MPRSSSSRSSTTRATERPSSAAIASGESAPIPAIRRAFALLARAPAGPAGKVIFFLTDGSIARSQQLRGVIAGHNTDGDVRVHTLLFARYAEDAELVLQDIAEANGGQYRFVSPGR